MNNLVKSTFTILKLLYNNSICIHYANNTLTIAFRKSIKKLKVINNTLVLDYNLAYLGTGNEAPLEENVKETEYIKCCNELTDENMLSNLLEEIEKSNK